MRWSRMHLTSQSRDALALSLNLKIEGSAAMLCVMHPRRKDSTMHLNTLGRAALQRLPIGPDPVPASRRRLVAVPPLEQPGDDIPSPTEKFVRALATQAFEAVEGTRSIAQLGAAISVGAARQLAAQRDTLRERREVFRDPRRCTPSPGRAHLCRISPHVAEATVVLHTGRRAHAVALRLEWAHGRWRAGELYVM